MGLAMEITISLEDIPEGCDYGINKIICIFMKSSKLPAILPVITNRKDMQIMDMILKTTELTKSFRGGVIYAWYHPI